MNSCKRLFAAILISIISTASFAAGSMRCGTRLVSPGDTKAEVLLMCGEPMLKETVGQKERAKRIDIPLDDASNTSKSQSRDNKTATASVRRKESVTTIIDQWTYNQGKGKLLKILTFEGGELVEIAAGDRY